jgi:hypothetical protein
VDGPALGPSRIPVLASADRDISTFDECLAA